jgi:hypothetical protein
MSDEATRDEMSRKATAHAEATVYSLNNTYLSRFQKAEVEAVYQFSFGIFTYAFAALALLADQAFWTAYLNATFIGALAWMLSRFVMVGKVYLPLSLILAGNGGMVVHLAISAYALFERRWGVAAFVGFEAFGLMAIFILPNWLWPMFFGGRMNPKYRIAKKMFGIEFPFERDL